MKIELDLPEEMVKDLEELSLAQGKSVADFASQLMCEVLEKQHEPIEIESRLAEGLADLDAGRSYGPFSTHAELMDCLREKSKGERG